MYQFVCAKNVTPAPLFTLYSTLVEYIVESVTMTIPQIIKNHGKEPPIQQLHVCPSQVLPSKLRQLRCDGGRLLHPWRKTEVLCTSWVQQGCEDCQVLLNAWAITAKVRPQGRVNQGCNPGRTVHESWREEKEKGVLLSGRWIVWRQQESVRQVR